MKKLLKPLLWVLILIMSISLVAVFSSGGCMPAVSPEEESVIIEEPVVEEPAEEPEEAADKIGDFLYEMEESQKKLPGLRDQFNEPLVSPIPIFIVVLLLLVIICLLWLIYSRKEKK